MILAIQDLLPSSVSSFPSSGANAPMAGALSMTISLSRRSVVSILVFGLSIVAAATFSAPSRAEGDPGAQQFVSEMATQAIQIVNDSSINRAGREAKFSDLLLKDADIQRIGAFCLGQYLHAATGSQTKEYLTLIQNFIVKVYVARLTGSPNDKFVVLGSVPKSANQVIVQSRMIFADGSQPADVSWWLLKTEDGRFKIFDVNVAGVWLAQEQRDAFTSVISRHNGDVGALLDHLRAQIAKADAGELPPLKTDEAGQKPSN
jgi:phospholipid transport system substrate-binding protein